MSGRAIYEALQRGALDAVEGEAVHPWLRAVGWLGAVRRAAGDMADEEEAAWLADDEAQLDEAEAEERPRLAAADGEEGPGLRYAGAGLVVRLVAGEAWTLEHVAGPPGLTVEWAGRAVPLEPGRPVAVPALAEPPERLAVVDGRGRRRRLDRQDG